MRELEWEVFHHTAERIRHGISRHLRLTNRRVAPHPKHAPRRVTVDLAKVTADPPCCGPTQRAMARVRDQWVVSGIGRD